MDRDCSNTLHESVTRAVADGQPLTIVGSGSKAFLLPAAAPADSRMLSVSEHQGVVAYRPDELVLTARSGTRLKDIRSLLAQHDQMLPFEPPEFRGQGSLGGAVACGLSGPGRPWRGSVRDAVLGVRLLNGFGEMLNFGGQVVKNVAGYDVSRLQTGAFGTLGLLLEISVRVVPRPAAGQTRMLELPAADALLRMRSWARRALPVTALCHVGERLFVRLEGAEAAVLAAAADIGGEVEPDSAFWTRLNALELDFFNQSGVLMCSRPAPAFPLPETWNGLIDWAGGRRWHYQTADEAIAVTAEPFDHRYAVSVCRTPGGDEMLAEYQSRLRDAFDPQGLFNPELSHADIAA